MTVKSLKTFGAGLVVAAFAALGLVAPAHAATISPTAVSSASIGTTGTNATPITVTATLATVGSADSIKVFLPSGWTFVAPTTCAANITKTATNGPISNCFVTVSGADSWIFIDSGIGAWTSAVTIAVTFNTGTLNVGASRGFNVEYKALTTVIDSGVASLSVASGHTATFNANGGTGTVAAQTASAATALTSNAFTKEGFTFTGWNTAADGTATAYADGASYAFTADVTLYAQWKAVLANTGFDGAPYLLVSNLLGVLGVAVLLMAARRRQRS